MAEFKIPQNRDAYAAILGFRYQVDWTIIRCCELPAESHLELECGEDIDTVAAALTVADEGAARTLEQIKHVGRSLSLRSPQCISAIANCISHIRANPEIDLRFRFCTNAEATVERPTPFLDRRPGIDVWRNLQRDTEKSSASADLEGIAEILRATSCPAGFSAKVWAEFQRFLKDSNPLDLLHLVTIFDWAVRQPAAETLSERVRELLQQMGWAATRREAEHLHARLFLRIMQILSQSGRKIILASFLEEEAQLPQLRDPERRLIAILTTSVFTIELRLEELERRAIEHDLSIKAASQRIDELASRVDSSASMLAGSKLVSILPPSQASHVVQRPEAVKKVNDLLHAHTWVQLRGSFGAGKTQLALLVTESREGAATWLSLRDCDEHTAAQLTLHLLARLAENTEPNDALETTAAAFQKLSRGSILVFEDLPRVTSGSGLARLISQICALCETHGISLLSTSHFDLDSALSSDLNCAGMLAPPLNKDEILQLLRLHEAPSGFLDSNNAETLLSAVAGHPMLATAAIRHLSSTGWDASALSAATVADHATDAVEQALRRLLQSVGKSQARDLLYRLARVVGSFQDRTLLAAAAARPPVERPKERFSAAEGIWIESYPDRHFSVSPLVRPLSETELGTRTKRRVDVALAKEMISRRTLSVVDVGTAALYFFRGGRPNQSALFLLGALGRAMRLPHGEIRYLLSKSWGIGPIPDEIEPAIKLSLRARQVALSERIGDSIEPLLDDADRLLAEAGDDVAWAKASYLLLTMHAVSSVDFQRSCRHVTALARMSELVATQMPVTGKTIARGMWDAIINIKNGDDLTAWVNCLDTFEQPFLREAFRWGPAKQGCGVAVNRPWMVLHVKKATRDEWEKLLRVYEYVEEIGSKRGVEVLRARAIVAQIFIHAEYLKDLPAAVRLADARLETGFLRESNRFLVLEALGRQYLYRNEKKNAIHFLKAAIELDASYYPEILNRTHLELGSVLGQSDPQAAVRHAQISADIARREPTKVSEMGLMNSLGELAIACWNAGDKRGAFLALDEAVDRYFLADLTSDESKQLLPRLGHCASYFGTVAATGQAPDYEEPSAVPFPREFLGWTDAMAEFHDERNFPRHVDSIFACLSMFAVAVEEDERAAYWAEKGVKEAAQHKNIAVTSLAGHQLFTPLVLDQRYSEALDRVREATWAAWCMHTMRSRNLPLDGPIDAKAILGARPNERWHGTEHWAIQQGMLPLTLRVATMHMQNPELAAPAVEQISDYVQQLHGVVALPSLWNSAHAFVRAATANTAEWMNITRDAERWPDDAPHGLRWLGYAACMMQSDVPIDQAAILHARLLCYIGRRLGSQTTIHRRLILPFSLEYWQRAIKHGAIPVNAESRLARTLESAKLAPTPGQDRIIAAAALTACDARVANSQSVVKKWLRET